jgi:Spy/CpxP family protein refolding chaperone
MKRNWKRMWGIMLMGLVLVGTGILISQRRTMAEAATLGMPGQEAATAFAGGPGMGHHGMSPNQETARLTDMLGLTEAQQTQVKALLTNGQPQFETLEKQMHALHATAMQAAMTTSFDEAKLTATLNAQAPAMITSAVAMAKVHAQIYALLTPEQQAKMQQHMTRMEQGPPPPPATGSAEN